jgi:hypothetical protein
VTRFLVLIYDNEHQWATANEEWNAENGRRHRAFLDAAGDAVLIGGELVPSARAVSIRCDGESHQSAWHPGSVLARVRRGGASNATSAQLKQQHRSPTRTWS